MRPASLWGHHARIVSLILRSDFLSRQLRSIVLRKGVSLQSRTMGRRVELGRLLEDDGLAIPRCIPDANILRCSRNSYTSPECSLQWQQKPRNNSFGSHDDLLFAQQTAPLRLGGWLVLVVRGLGASKSAERKFHRPIGVGIQRSNTGPE